MTDNCCNTCVVDEHCEFGLFGCQSLANHGGCTEEVGPGFVRCIQSRTTWFLVASIRLEIGMK